jgi:hypothetical protein
MPFNAVLRALVASWDGTALTEQAHGASISTTITAA